MAARNKPYDQFGPYVLFKNLEVDALGELWRAARIDHGEAGPAVALRRLTGGDRSALAAGAQSVSHLLPQLHGTSFVREQQAGVIDGVPFLAWQYGGGRSLRHVVSAARGNSSVHANPLPLDQAIVIAEKVALSLTTTSELRDGTGARLCHGALIPHFIWISEDGEIRVAGQQFGSALMPSLGDPKVAAELARYFSPESRTVGQVHKTADVYSMGAVLFLLVTGQEPPDAATASAFGAAVRAGKTWTGEPIPDDIRIVLDKSFNIDPSMRYASIGDMKQAISTLANSGRYLATTFNLAFYLSTLLKKEMEVEAAEREKESKLNAALYAEPGVAPAAPALAGPVVTATPEPATKEKKSRAALAAAAVVVLGVLGTGAYFLIGNMGAQPKVKQAVAVPIAPRPTVAPPVVSQPIAVSASPEEAVTSTGTALTDEELKKKAFEEAVNQKLQAQMMKLQGDFMTELKRKQAATAPVAAVASIAPVQVAAVEERPSMTAAELDQQRRDARLEAAAASPASTVASPPVPTQTAPPQVAAPVPQPASAVPAVRDGDVIDVGSLDSVPQIVRSARPQYPPLAARQKIAATIFLTALISETGDVLDVRVLRGEPRFGLNDAAVRAIRATKFSPPMKDGRKVRTWFPQTIAFKP